MVLELIWGELSWLPGLTLVTIGLLVAASVAFRPPAGGSEPLRLALTIRRLIWGAALVMLGGALALQAPVLLAAAAVIGFEETLETGIVVYALRRDIAATT